MSLLFALIAILAIGGVAAFAAGRWGVSLSEAERDLRPDQVQGQSSFDVVIRGYRMDEVDARIADLERELARLRRGGSDSTVR